MNSLCFGAMLSILVGCGGGGDTGPQLDIATTTGIVTLDGSPLEGVAVTLFPNAGGVPATGRTDANGKFELTTKNPGDGAIVGHHTVTITDPAEVTMEETGENTSEDAYAVVDPGKMSGKVPAIYADAMANGLGTEIKAGSNDLKFELKSK